MPSVSTSRSYTVTLSEEEMRLILAALNRQLRGEDVKKGVQLKKEIEAVANIRVEYTNNPE